MPDNARFGILWMGRNALEAAHDMDGAFNDVVIKLSHGASEQEVIRKVDDLTRRFGGLGAFGRDDHVSDMFIRNEITQLKAMAFLLPIIFLAIAGFLTHMVLARLIALEREQIGVLKAIGFSNAQVAIHYIKFSLVIGIAAAFVGILLVLWVGQGMAEIYAMFFRFPALHFVYAPDVMILAVLIALGASTLGAWRAARVVVRLPAAEAMKPEPPPSFRPVLAERLGLSRFISPAGRMILRQLERRGRRSFFTSVGIGSSLGILIAASFTLDSLDFVLDIQFNQSEREDIGIALTEAGSRQAYHDLAHLPGVLRAEPYRSVPVKIRAGQLTERTALLGLEPDGDLHRILDIGLRAVPIAPDGIVLNERLAQDLQVVPGDRLTIEVLVGRRPTLTVHVASVVQQYLSTGAFMDLAALNALMQEGPSITGAWLRVDESRMPSFFAAVKDTPAISGLSIRKAAIESFRKMLAENIVQMSLANIGFAALIIFGVVYNSARISLSERARELASMRVLGFSRGEISTILLGELAILVFAAIPIGYLMGYGLAQGIVISMDTELFRIPLIIDRDTYGWTALVVLVAAALSGLVVRRRLDHLNLVEVLKSRE